MRIKILLSLLLSSIILIFFLFFNIDGIRSYLKKNLSHETKIYIKKIFFGEEYLNEVFYFRSLNYNQKKLPHTLFDLKNSSKFKKFSFNSALTRIKYVQSVLSLL